MYSPSHQALADLMLPNMREYTDRHGYHSSIFEISNDSYEYKKHNGFEYLFKDLYEGDIIWYRDVDSIITDLSKPITDFIDNEHDLFITEDIHELNGGSVIIRNSAWGRWFNGMVLSNKDKYANEQNVYNANRDMVTISGSMKILPHPSINSYDYSIYPEYPNIRSREQGHWHEGDFVLHTPGAPMEVRLNTLKNAKIIR